MASKGGTQTVTSQPDPATQAYVNQMRQYALGATGQSGTPTYSDPARAQQFQALAAKGGSLGRVAQRSLDALAIPGQAGGGAPSLPPELLAAQQQYGQYAQAGNLGLGALTGGPNPFMNSYLSGMDPQWAQLRQQSLGAIGDQATLAGAFGGSRHGVAEGVAMGELGNAQAQQQYQAFNDAQQRAMQTAQMGYGAQANSAFLPQQYYGGQLGLMGQAIGPYGTSQTQPTQGGGLTGLLGAGLSVASMIPGPWQVPAIAGGLAGR